jgi:putative ABC transport system permease protein
LISLWRNVRFGLRLLRKSPGFAAVAILSFAFGIGATTAIASIVYGTLLAPMPYPHPEQIVAVWSKIDGNRNGVSAGDFLDWKAQSQSFRELAALGNQFFNLSIASQPEEVNGGMVPPGFFSRVFASAPVLGRDFSQEEGVLGKDRVVILSHRLWVRRFGSDRNVIGSQIRIDGELRRVVGVLALGAYDKYWPELWVPLTFKPEQINHDFHWLVVIGRLKPSVSISRAQADMDAVTRHIGEVYPKSNGKWGAIVQPYQNTFLSADLRRAIWVFFAAVAAVLLIVCANVANLLLARFVARQKEVAIRSALGATTRQIFSQFVAESLSLAVLGGIAGIGLGWAIERVVMASMPPFSIPGEADVKISLPVLGFAFAVTLVSGVAVGCVPAWQAARMNTNDVLKEGGRSARVVGRRWLRRGLVVTEFALALVLLAGAGLLLHSFWNFGRADLGVRRDHVLTFTVPIPADRFPETAQLVAFYKQLNDKIAALPGAKSVAVSTGIPTQYTGFGMPFSIVGRTVADPSDRPGALYQMVTPEYYQTYGVRVVKGRAFTEQDAAGGLRVAMVSEAFVKKFLSDVDPLTQRLAVEEMTPGVTKLGAPVEWQIVGVFHDVQYGGYSGLGGEGQRPEIDVPFWQSPWPSSNFGVQTVGDPAAMNNSIAKAVRSVDPDLPIATVKTMDQTIDESLQGNRVEAGLLLSFAGVALVLAAIGIYGVLAFSVVQRTGEIGTRLALGAQASDVLRLILREGLVLALTGLGLGLLGTLFLKRLMATLLFGIGVVDPGAIMVVSALLVAVALLACYLPARRAARVDPLVALRES